MLLDIYIHSPGDYEACIPDGNWTIEDIEVEDNDHRELIRQSVSDLFSSVIVDGAVEVTFSDENDDPYDIAELKYIDDPLYGVTPASEMKPLNGKPVELGVESELKQECTIYSDDGHILYKGYIEIETIADMMHTRDFNIATAEGYQGA